MVPGIRPHGRAFHRNTFAQDKAKQRFLDHDHDDQHEQRVGGGSAMRLDDFTHRLDRDPHRREQQHGRDDGRGDGFRFAMTVGMIFVRRRRGHHEAAPDDDRAEQIGQRFDSVRDQRMRMPDEAGEHLRSCEQDIGDHSQKRHAQAALETGR